MAVSSIIQTPMQDQKNMKHQEIQHNQRNKIHPQEVTDSKEMEIYALPDKRKKKTTKPQDSHLKEVQGVAKEQRQTTKQNQENDT